MAKSNGKAKKKTDRDEEDVYRELAEMVMTSPVAMVMLGLALHAKETGGDEGFDALMEAWDVGLDEAEALQRRAAFHVVEDAEDSERGRP